MTEADNECKQRVRSAPPSNIMRHGLAGRRANELQDVWVQHIMKTNHTVADVVSH